MGRSIAFVTLLLVACAPPPKPPKKVVADRPAAPPPADAVEPETAAPEPAAPAPQEPGPFVWSVKKGGKEVHVLGTMPVFGDEVPMLAQDLAAGANVIGFETPPDAPNARSKADSTDKSLKQRLGLDYWRKLLAAAPLDSPARLDTAHPGFLVRYLIRGRTEAVQLTAERAFHAASKHYGKTIAYAYPDRNMWLDSYHLANFERLVAELKRFLDDPDAVRAERDRQLAAYRAGQLAPLLRPEAEAASDWNKQLVFTAARMVEDRMKKPETFLMVMDVRRVVGPFGLLAYLRDLGMTVERLGAGTSATKGQAPPPRASATECTLYHFHRRSVLAMRGPATWGTLPRATDAERAKLVAQLQTPEAKADYTDCKTARTWTEIRCALAARTPATLEACLTPAPGGSEP